jgi:DNA-binding MarR family transcriptional regulator
MNELQTPMDALREFYVEMHRALDRMMKANGASFARTKLLLYIERCGSVRSADIAEAFGHAPRTTTEAIDGLERDGLVRRDPDPDDRRAKRISVTPAGLAAVGVSGPILAQYLSDVFAVLDQNECETLTALFCKLNNRVRGLNRSEGDINA